ncbi:hypothetical protein OsI_23692 [Oryza sativa Indica Group]|uniref:DNA endonuclease activator Ctp1 C-terminal domain-containing protein n=1 Tax=Oryza sativa subsp. indica TaxID=39946 RepID=B8B4L3_ORYSI|nr:hypothetical protein OsI_23692 [Oryza sativa Indica Group]
MIRNPKTPEEAQALAASPPKDMDFNNSDDETQDVNIATQGQKNMPVPKQQSTISIQPPNKGFKYTEPVRKKADRENLKGVECKQCKKFYDAVLPDGRTNGDGVDSTSMRCEHHDGVSRHRYSICNGRQQTGEVCRMRTPFSSLKTMHVKNEGGGLGTHEK